MSDRRAGLQQKDNLCGPFQASRLLRDIGVTAWAGEEVDQDLLARHAGTCLPANPVGAQVPPGAQEWREYRFELPAVAAGSSGTTAHGLAEAIEELSGGRRRCVPVSGAFTSDAVCGLVDGVRELEGRLIANVRTGRLWGSRPPLELLLAVLEGGPVEPAGSPPAAEWDVGHFVELAALVRGRAGALVLVRDSYPSLGWDGCHLQPPAAVAAALLRGDGREGGVLAVVPAACAAAAERLATRLELEVKLWDNCEPKEEAP